MSTLIATAFVPVRFSMLLRGPGTDAPGRALVERLRSPDRPSVYPPELLVLTPETELIARIEYGTPAGLMREALEAVLEAVPELAGGAGAELSPTDPDAQCARELARVAEKAAPEQVLPALREWLRHAPHDHPETARVQLALGVALARSGDHLAAEAAWRQLLEHHPHHPLRHQADYLLKDVDAWPTRLLPAVEDTGGASLFERPVLQPFPHQFEANRATVTAPPYRALIPGLPMVQIPAGTFEMGAQSPHLTRESPVRTVTLTRSYWMSAWPLTRAVVRALGWPLPPGPAEADDLPATGISFPDAQELCRRLSARAGVTVRLPTEAEWERAARGGLPGAEYPWGTTPITPDHCNYALPRAIPVGSYPPNPYGLFDMVGNTQEWTADRFLDDAYARTPAKVSDPTGPATDESGMALRAVRGGLCGAPMCAQMCRNAFRIGLTEGYSGGSIAVRVVVDTFNGPAPE